MSKNHNEETPMNQSELNFAQHQIMKIIQSQNLESIEEINEFLEKNVTGHYIPDILEKFRGELSDKEKADELAVKASRTAGKKALELIEEGLKLDPENVRCWTKKGIDATSTEEAHACFMKAYEYGKKELGENYFIESKGDFWGLPETRPFMEAAKNLSDTYILLKKFDQAYEILSELLELNPRDNQGNRYTISGLMLVAGKFSEFVNLAKEYQGDTSAFWQYNRAFYYFLREGNSKRAKEALKNAKKSNKFIFQMITGQRKIGDIPNDYYVPGSEEEASIYVMENFDFWSAKPAALYWLMSHAYK